MKLTIAIEGCCHGELDRIYATLQLLEQREGRKIDLLICCGDFQAVRNLDDLETMACPPKYRSMASFYKYYSGEKVAPFPTIFIGGNHEAANHLWELYHGGWAAPNIFFLGFAGAVRFGGLRIAGLSGIYKSHDYTRGHHEALPYSDNAVRSLYHVRDFEVYRLLQLRGPVDIFLSHDWPTNIARHGNTAQLLARKSFLRSEVESGTLGSPPAAQLLAALRPAYWFSAHLHTKFAALVVHEPAAAAAGASSSAPAAASGAAAASAAGGGAGAGGGGGGGAGGAGGGGFPATRFLALDKCLQGRDFLQVIEVEAPGPPGLHYDEEWLAILRTTHALTNLRHQHAPLPGMGALRSGPRPEDVEFVRQALAARGSTAVPDNFVPTAPPYDPASGQRKGCMPQRHVRNPQTVALFELLGLPYNLEHGGGGGFGPPPPPLPSGLPGPPTAAPRAGRWGQPAPPSGAAAPAAEAAASGRPGGRAPLSLAPRMQLPPPHAGSGAAVAAAAPNPEEIDLGDLDEDEDEDGGGGGANGGAGGDGGGGAAAAGGGGSEAAADGDAGGGGGAHARLADDPMFQPLDL